MQAEQLVTNTDERVAITVDSLMVRARYLSGIPGESAPAPVNTTFSYYLRALTHRFPAN